MIEFRLIDSYTYRAIQDTFKVLKEASRQTFDKTILGEGSGLSYVARLRDIATTDITDPDTGVADPEKIRETAEQITPLINTLTWTNDASAMLLGEADEWGMKAVDALKNIQTVALAHANLPDRWWVVGNESACEYTVTTLVPVTGTENKRSATSPTGTNKQGGAA